MKNFKDLVTRHFIVFLKGLEDKGFGDYSITELRDTMEKTESKNTTVVPRNH